MKTVTFFIFLFLISFGIKAQTFNFKRMFYVDWTTGSINQGIDQYITSNITFILTDSILESSIDLSFKKKGQSSTIFTNEDDKKFIINISSEQIEIIAEDKSKYYLFSL